MPIVKNTFSTIDVMLDGQMLGAMGQLLAVVEQYPDLKADKNYMHLQRTLTETEEQIAAVEKGNVSVSI